MTEKPIATRERPTLADLREYYVKQLILASLQLMPCDRNAYLRRVLEVDDMLYEIEGVIDDTGEIL